MHYAPRVKETTTTTGTGTYSLGGAASGGFQIFLNGIGDGNETWYCCTNANDWEIGIGTVANGSPDTLARTKIVHSSNYGSAIDWPSGTKDIFCIFPPKLLGLIDGDWDSGVIGSNTIERNDEDSWGSVAIGTENTVAGVYNIVIGFDNIVTSGAINTLVFGQSCAVVDDSATQNKPIIFSSGGLNSAGDTQVKIFTSCVETTDATETGLGYFVLSGSSDNTGTALYEISVVARQTGGSGGTVGDSKSWKLDCMVTFDEGVLAQVGTTVSSVIGASAGASAWACAIDVSDNATGPIRVTGEANETIQWVAFIRQIENSTGVPE